MCERYTGLFDNGEEQFLRRTTTLCAVSWYNGRRIFNNACGRTKTVENKRVLLI